MTFLRLQSVQQQSSSETEEGGNAADGSSEGEEGDSAGEEDEKEKLKEDKTGSKRKKTASSKVLHSAGAWEGSTGIEVVQKVCTLPGSRWCWSLLRCH